MAENDQHIIALLDKYAGGKATAAETEALLALLRQGNHDESVVSYIASQLEAFEPVDAADIAFWKDRLKGGAAQITGTSGAAQQSANIDIPAAPVHRVHFMRRWGWAAASVLLLLGIGAYLYNRYSHTATTTQPVVSIPHIPPGKSGAILTLADGTLVVLDSLGNGVVATQNGTQVVLKGGGLAYDAGGSATGEVTYNTMTTPKGRQFQVTLPDGTQVWLNAGSSLRYPTVFTGAERRVTVTGEAYFEVAHMANKPFKVDVNGKEEVTVLGTHFNIHAYDNEPSIHTTLLQGSVRVTGGGSLTDKTVTLKPGQQAQLATQGAIKVVTDADIDQVMAWKNGLFNFEGASLGEVMRQLERWYDITVAYEKGIPHVEFEGKMTRDVPLHDLLTMLERSDVHFRLEGRKLVVLP